MPRWLLFLGYPIWFSISLVVALYMTFPVNALKDQIVTAGEKALGKGDRRKVGRHGVDPQIRAGKIDLYRLTGLSFSNLSVQLASSNPDPGMTIEFDELNVAISPFSLVGGAATIVFDGRMWNGDFSGEVELDTGELSFVDAAKQGKISGAKSVRLDVDGLRLDRSTTLMTALGVPAGGSLDIDVDLVPGENPAKEGQGRIEVHGKGLVVGPGEYPIPLFGNFSIPQTILGELDFVLPIVDGHGTAEKFSVTGQHISAQADVDLTLSKRLESSRLQGGGWFSIDEGFLKANPKFNTILDFDLPQASFKKARDDDGRYHYSFSGQIKKPRFKLSRTGGKDVAKKRKRSRRKSKKDDADDN